MPQDETVLDIATDKVDSEVPSTAEGIIEEILFKENDVVPIGTLSQGSKGAEANEQTSSPCTTAPAPKHEFEEANVVEEIPFAPTILLFIQMEMEQIKMQSGFTHHWLLNIARVKALAMTELENIPGTGQDGSVSKKDILHIYFKKNPLD